VTKFIEKPKNGETHSTQAAIWKYILTPDIFHYLENAQSSVWDGEIRLADAFIDMLQDDAIYAYNVVWTRYDTGSKVGYLKACIAYAMKDPELASDMKDFLKSFSS
jgi:UTP--glucose-1-phosphate uridylyltransferase